MELVPQNRFNSLFILRFDLYHFGHKADDPAITPCIQVFGLHNGPNAHPVSFEILGQGSKAIQLGLADVQISLRGTKISFKALLQKEPFIPLLLDTPEILFNLLKFLRQRFPNLIFPLRRLYEIFYLQSHLFFFRLES